MAHVLLVLLHIVNRIQESCGDISESIILLLGIEKRCKREENALFFLAFALHPSFHKSSVDILSESLKKNGNWNKARNYLCVARIAHAAVFYYETKELHPSGSTETECNEEQQRLDKQLRRWLEGTSNLAVSIYKGERKEYMVEWWEENSDELPEISNLAKFILDYPIQGARCEQFFKDFARFHTKVRNRLHTSTTLQSTQILHGIRRKYPEQNKPGSGTFTRNRMVGVDEYVREDNLLLP